MSEAKEQKSSSKKSKEKKVNRILKGEKQIHHDLFRLENQMTKKNVSFNASPIWEAIEHKHFYHNIDSDGKPQDKCAPTAGHFHYIEVEEVDGELIAKCSEPYCMKVVNGKRQAVPYENDNHKHDVTYLQSEIVTQRVFNDDAMKVISHIQNKQAQRMSNPAK